MDNEQLNNDFEEQFKEQLENLPEERPSVKDWELLRDSLKKEGLIKSDSRWRKYFLFFLLPAVIGGAISIPLLTNRYSIDLSFISSSGDSVEQDKIITNHSDAKASTGNVSDKTKALTDRNTIDRPNVQSSMKAGDAAANNSDMKVQLLAQQRRKKIHESTERASKEDGTEKNISQGATDNNRGVEPTSGNVTATMNGNEDSTITQAGNNSGEKAIPDSAITPPQEKSADTTRKDTAVVKDTLTKSSDGGRKPWVGFFVSWDFTAYHLKENNNVNTSEAKAVINSSDIGGENSLAQYTLGIMGGLRVTKKFALEAGVFYSQKRKLSNIISSPAGVDAQGNESFSDFTYNYSAKYIEAYGRIKYYFLEKKHSFYAGIGAAGSFNFPSSKADRGYFERVTFSETAAPQTDIVTLEASSAGFSVVVCTGMEVVLSQRWNLFVEPSYKHALTSVTRHPYYDKIPVEHFWRTFSLGTGLMYKF